MGDLVSGPESEELRALRVMEREAFGPQAIVRWPDSGVRVSEGPPAIRSDTPEPTAPTTPAPSRDLSYLRNLTLPALPVRWDDRVVRYIEMFTSTPSGRRHIAAWLRRVDRYGPMIRAELRENGLPEDLIFVAMVESGFDPGARSHAGAVGLWQFVSGTGRELGLTIDHWVDLRNDPEASTRAAARYLGMLQRRFGTWELTFAAYNMGYGALLRAIRKYNTNDYWELAHLESGLPYETNLYVAKILACAIVAHNRERFGFTDLEMEAPLRWSRVRVPGGTPLHTVARAAGVEPSVLSALNPALRRGRTPPGGNYEVRLPSDSVARFNERWARSRPGSPTTRTHVLRFGETLADLARTSGAREDELRELNGVVDDERIGVGTPLLVPIRSGRPNPTPSVEEVVSVPPGVAVPAGRRRVFYRVVRGDSAAEIARFFRVPVTSLAEWNRLDPDATLQSGMFLQLFVDPALDLSQAIVLSPDDVRVLVIGSDEFFAYHEGQNGRVRVRYRIQSGDTLTSIGRRFGIEVASLARINQISASTTLRVGEELIVYAEPSRVPAELRPDALTGDALAPGGEGTVERTGPELGAAPSDAAPIGVDDPSEAHAAP
ncbi:MAG: LysM peptidoglycan-binding domain-containing protein [Sandaracinaceae bacterium]